tara:strand:+ start:618 stop:1214 length:597 start_codon:yes stop_codon:yes gene_type:complete
VSKTEWLKIPEYAKRVAKTPQYIRRLVKNGKITKKALKLDGKRFLIDPAQADEDLAANTSHVNKKPPVKQPKKETKRTKKETVSDEEKKQTIQEAGLENLVSLAEAQKLKENYVAALKKLELEEKRGDLLRRDEVERAEAELVLSARTKILSIKGTLAPLLKEFINDHENFGIAMRSVDDVLRDTLQELADGGFRHQG